MLTRCTTTPALTHNLTSTFLSLPLEIHRLIFDHLPLPDRGSLSLTCKPLASELEYCGALNWDPDSIRPLHTCVRYFDHDPVSDLIKTRLGQDWFPAHLKYCCKCGKYVPRSPSYWEAKLHEEFFLRAGNWGKRYRRWMNRQVMNDSGELVEPTLRKVCDFWPMAKPQTCPRCKLMA